MDLLVRSFRYICDNGTYIARYDDLFDGRENPIDVSKVDVSTDGIELQDREFLAAISEGREPNASVAQCLPAMQTLDRLEQSLKAEATRYPSDRHERIRGHSRHLSFQQGSVP